MAVKPYRDVMSTRPTKEPIQKPWIWVVMVFIILAGIPWYLPKGTIGFVLLGVPYWMFISVAFSLLLCVYLSWLCFTQWNLVEAEEEIDHADRSEDTVPRNNKD
jgi:hypothetical protein